VKGQGMKWRAQNDSFKSTNYDFKDQPGGKPGVRPLKDNIASRSTGQTRLTGLGTLWGFYSRSPTTPKW